MTKRRFMMLGLVVSVIPVALLVHRGGKESAGPLRDRSTNRSLSSGQAVPGQWAVTTVLTTALSGHSPAVIDSVQPTDQSQAKGVDLRYAVLANRDHGSPGLLRGWPPHGYPLTSIHGFTVHPGENLALIVGAASLRTGTWRITDFTIRYHIGTTSYAATYPQGIGLDVTPKCRPCATPDQLTGRLHSH